MSLTIALVVCAIILSLFLYTDGDLKFLGEFARDSVQGFGDFCVELVDAARGIKRSLAYSNRKTKCHKW